jgi:hypothetical protein
MRTFFFRLYASDRPAGLWFGRSSYLVYFGPLFRAIVSKASLFEGSSCLDHGEIRERITGLWLRHRPNLLPVRKDREGRDR